MQIIQLVIVRQEEEDGVSFVQFPIIYYPLLNIECVNYSVRNFLYVTKLRMLSNNTLCYGFGHFNLDEVFDGLPPGRLFL